MNNPRASGPAPFTKRARLATALRQAREEASLSGLQAARLAGFGQSKLSKIERAELLPSAADVRALCTAYGTPAPIASELAQLARELKAEKAARLILTRSPARTRRRIEELEQQARSISGFHPITLPAMLHTPAYAGFVPRPGQPQPSTRRTVPGRDDMAVHLIVGEAALRARIAPAPVMARQLDALATATTWPGLTLGVMAWSDAVRVLPDHGFTIYDTTCVLVSVATASLAISTASETAIYTSLFTGLSDQARYGEQARQHLAAIAAQYHTEAAR